MYVTKIRLHEILTSEIFYRRKYPDLRYIKSVLLTFAPNVFLNQSDTDLVAAVQPGSF